MQTISEFVDRTAPVRAGTLVSDVYERFDAEPATLVIAVTGEDDRVVGIVERNSFSLRLAAEFGRALYARRPIEAVMEPNPVVVEAEVSADRFFAEVGASDVGVLMSGFVVVRDGRYFGVGAGVHVLRAGMAVHRQRAEEMTRLAENLAWAEAEAVASSRAKSQFLAVMSHEIRTPLNGVLGVAELMERKLTQEELRPYVRTILDSGQGLLRLLTDALDLSRAEAGALSLEDRPFALRPLAEDLDALWRPCAEQRDLDFTLEIAGDIDRWALGDPMRVKQVFNNLIGNALKFTSEGGVHVRLAAEGDGQHLRISGAVTDSGPGVPPDLAPTLFDPFTTGAGEREGAGAGLGLSICRELVERMDGGIRLETPPEGGARFLFDIVLFEVPAQSETAHEEAVPPTPHDTLHVLVVDDNPTNRFVACKLLETFGCTADTAEDGAQAVEAAALRPYDLILMDIKMPVMDGLQATHAIRALGGDVARIPIVALTANADPHDQDGYLAHGMNDVVEKPIKPDALLSAIRRVLSPAEPAAAAA